MIRKLQLTEIGSQNLKSALKTGAAWAIKAIGFGDSDAWQGGSETDLLGSNKTYFDVSEIEPDEYTITYNITLWGGQLPVPIKEIGLFKNRTETNNYLFLRAVCDPIYITNQSSWIHFSISLTFK
mgnify:CR=1 FL=1